MRRHQFSIGVTVALILIGTSLAADDTTCATCADATDPATCAPFPGGVLTGVHDNVVVPPGALCFISGATIHGSVKALENSQLLIDTSTVGGSIEGDKAEVVHIEIVSVSGNVIIKEGEVNDPSNDVAIEASEILGNVEIAKMTGNIFMENAGTIGGDLKVEENLLDAGGVEILNVDIGGNLQVFNNIAATQANVSENTVGGNLQVFNNTGTTFAFHVGVNHVSKNLQVFKNTGFLFRSATGNIVGGSLQCFENQEPFVGGPNAAGDAEGQCF